MVNKGLVGACVTLVILLPSALGQSASRYCYEGLASRAAQRALETGDAAQVVIWVSKAHEGEVRNALDKARRVRTLSPEAREVADGYFIQTLNCMSAIDRGRKLEPRESRELGPAVPSAEKAVEANSTDHLTVMLMDMLRQEVQQRFQQVMDKKRYDPKDVEAGRRYIQVYAHYVDYIDGIYTAIQGGDR